MSLVYSIALHLHECGFVVIRVFDVMLVFGFQPYKG